MVLSTFCWIKLCLKNHYAAKSFQQSLFFEEFLKCNVILEAHYISFMPKLWKVFNFPEKKVCNLLCRHIFIMMLTYNKIEDIFDKNIFWRVKQAFVITHNCWRSIFENIMLTKLVMSYYLQIELFKYYQALLEYARSKSTSSENMVTQTIFHNF